MAEYLIQDKTLIDIADAIREKTGKTGAIYLTEMGNEVRKLSDATSSMGTCEVIINYSGENDGNVEHTNGFVSYMTTENGSITGKVEAIGNSDDVTCNVIKGSLIVIYAYGAQVEDGSFAVAGGAEYFAQAACNDMLYPINFYTITGDCRFDLTNNESW